MKEKLLDKLNTSFKNSIESFSEFRNELTIIIKKADIEKICSFLRDDAELSFDSLRDICGAVNRASVDRYEVVNNLYSLKNKYRLRLKVLVDADDMNVPTVTRIWPTADFEEREAYDMYGIVFDNHPDLRRIYMPEEFEYYPLRKDFPLMGIPGSLPLPRK